MPSPNKNPANNQSYASLFLEGSFWLIKKMVNSPGHALTFLTFLTSSFNLVEANERNRQPPDPYKLTVHNLTNPIKVTNKMAGVLEQVPPNPTTNEQSQYNQSNNPPVYTGPTTIQFRIGEGINHALEFVDPEGDKFVCGKLEYISYKNEIFDSSSPWFDVDPETDTIKENLSSGQHGYHPLYVRATDQRGAVGWQKLTMKALNTRPNISFKPISMHIGQSKKLAIPSNDKRGISLNIDYVKTLNKNSSQEQMALPPWATFEPKSYKLHIRPDKSGDQGFYSLIWFFKQCFAYLRHDTDSSNCHPQPIKTSVDITIHNRPPFVKKHFDDQVIHAFEQWRFSLAEYFGDRDGDPLKIIIENKPNEVEYNDQLQMLEAYFTSILGFEEHEVYIRAIDIHGGHASASLNLKIKSLMAQLFECFMTPDAKQPLSNSYQQDIVRNKRPMLSFIGEADHTDDIGKPNQTEVDTNLELK